MALRHTDVNFPVTPGHEDPPHIPEGDQSEEGLECLVVLQAGIPRVHSTSVFSTFSDFSGNSFHPATLSLSSSHPGPGVSSSASFLV